MRLADLKERYNLGDGAKHEPKDGCAHCGGSGQRPKVDGSGLIFCICLFVDHDVSDEIGFDLGDFARSELDKMEADEG